VIAPRAAAGSVAELLKGRGHEDPDPPGVADVRPLAWRPRRGFHDRRGHSGGCAAEAGRVSPGADLRVLAGVAFLVQVVLPDAPRGAAHPPGDRE